MFEDPAGLSFPNAGAERSSQLEVSPALFQKFQKLIYAETGIWLSNSKTALLCGRLFKRLRTLELSSLNEYYDRVSHPEQQEERCRMIDAITTNETRFFREPRQFDFLIQTIFPRWQSEAEQNRRPKKIRIWSAGCSSGEEPYTLAMLLVKHFPAESGWDVSVLATDISNRILEKARKGIYPLARAGELPRDLLHEYVLRGTGEREGEMKVRVDLQRMIEFRRLNLHRECDLAEGPFDAIFCRNVLIYFDAASKQSVINNLISHLNENSYLFVGHAENLSSLSTQLRSLESTIYIKTGNCELR